MVTRRKLLLLTTGTLTALSGCLESVTGTPTPEPTATEKPDSDFDGVPDSEDDYPDDITAAETVIDLSERVEIPSTEFKTYSINIERDGVIGYEMIAEGGPIDLFFLDQEDYDKWQKGDSDAEYRIVLSAINTAAADTEQLLPAGDWVLVLDHTETQTLPNEQAITVDFSLEVSMESEQMAENETSD